MKRSDQICLIQGWVLQHETGQGILYLRTRDTKEQRIVNIFVKKPDYHLANVNFKKKQFFFLRPWMKNKQFHTFNQGPAFKSHWNTHDYALNSVLLENIIQLEEQQAKKNKIQQQQKLKQAHLIKEKGNGKKVSQKYIRLLDNQGGIKQRDGPFDHYKTWQYKQFGYFE